MVPCSDRAIFRCDEEGRRTVLGGRRAMLGAIRNHELIRIVEDQPGGRAITTIRCGNVDGEFSERAVRAVTRDQAGVVESNPNAFWCRENTPGIQQPRIRFWSGAGSVRDKIRYGVNSVGVGKPLALSPGRSEAESETTG